MLRKADLRKLPKLSLTSKIKSLATSKSKHKNYCGRTYKGLCRYFFRATSANKILKISVFDAEWIKKGIQGPTYDIFIDADQAEYISLEHDTKGGELRWRKSMVSNLLEYTWSQYETAEWSSFGTDSRVRKILGKSLKGDCYRIVNSHQSNILEERIKKKEARECAEYDKDMKPVKEITDAFRKWLKKEVIADHYIFYHYSGNIKKGYCSHCDRWVDLKGKNVKNGVKDFCPSCGARITYKSEGKIKTLSTDNYFAQLVQPYPGGYIVRCFRVHMYYKNSDFRNPIIHAHEYHRYLNGETSKFYSWEMYKNKYMRWIKKNAHDYYNSEGKVYPRNLKLLPDYDTFRRIFEKQQNISLSKWAIKVRKGTIYERLINAGFMRLFSEMFSDSYYFYDEIKSEETALHKNLKLDKMRLKRLKAMDGGNRELRWFQAEKEANTVWPDEMIRAFSDGGLGAYTFTFCPKQMTYPQIWEYLKKQYILHGYTWDYTIACWRDYLDMAKKLHIPLNIERNYKPKDVRLAHNEARDILQGKDIEEEAKKLDRKWKKLKKIYPKLEKYEYSDKDYQIMAPKTTKDIVREGMILKHCVHTCDFYFQRMTSDETYILFLRKASEPSSPYYTLEVEPSGNIRQKRTTGDRQNKDFEEARRFLAKWQRAIQKRLTKEEKALGKKSNALRIQELKELRKNGNRVWHGVLQGQLLADVLEADFMPVMAEEKGKAV